MRLIDADALEADLKQQYEAVFANARKTVNPDDFFIERYAAYHANVTKAEQDGFFEYLKTRPTVDAVEVVRCRDCKWYQEGELLAPNKFCFRLKHPEEDRKIGYNYAPDDFCSHGERKGGVRDGT